MPTCVEFVEWLYEHNHGLPSEQQAGFYGMDLYALHASMRAVLEYLDKHDPEAARRARDRYSCFDRYGGDPPGVRVLRGIRARVL